MAKLIIQLMNEEWTVDLQVGSNILGRASTCGIPLKDPSLSRQHCDIVWVGGQATVVDKGSLNGTLVNGRKISEHKLEAGEKITIGATTIWYERKNIAPERPSASDRIRKTVPAADPSASSGVVTRRTMSASPPSAAPSTRAAPAARAVAPQTAETPPPARAVAPARVDGAAVDAPGAAELLQDYAYRGRPGFSWIKIAVTTAVLAGVAVGAYWAKDLVASAPTVEIDKDNLIRNPSFEGLSRPEGWLLRAPGALGPLDRTSSTLSIDQAQGRHAGPCLVLEKSTSSAELAVECAYLEAFPVGGRQVRAEAWTKTDGFGGRVAFKIDWLRGSNGPVVGEETSDPPVVGANAWTKMGATFSPPAGAGAFRIALAAVGRTGRIYFDDVLVKTEPAGSAPLEKKLGAHRARPCRQGVLTLGLRGRSAAILNISLRLESDKEGSTSQAFATDVRMEDKEEGALHFLGKMLHPADLREIEFEGGVEAVQGGTAVYYKFRPEALRQIDRVTIVMTLPRPDGVHGLPERSEDATSHLSFGTEAGEVALDYFELAKIRVKKAEGRLRLAQSFAVDTAGADEVGFGFRVREAGAGGGSLDPAAEAAEARKKGQLGQALSVLRGLVKTVKENGARERMETEIRGLEENEKRDWADVQGQVFQARLTRRPDQASRAKTTVERYLAVWAGEGTEGKAGALQAEMQKELSSAAEGESERPRRILDRAKKCLESGKKALAQSMLQVLVARYPQSDAFAEAEKLLKDLSH